VAGNSDRPPAPPPAGWFADPAGSPYLRWWDGAGWTDNFIDARTGAPPAELAPAAAPRGAIAVGSASVEDSAGGDTESVVSSTETETKTETQTEPGDRASATPSSAASADPQSSEAPPLTRREARARERLAEEARANAGAIPPLVEPGQPQAAVPAPAPLAQPAQSPPALPAVVPEAEELLAQPVSAARTVDSLGEVSDPDAVAAPEEIVASDSVREDAEPPVGAVGAVDPASTAGTAGTVSSVGTIGIPTPDLPETEHPPGLGAVGTPARAIPLPGSTVSAPSFADVVTGPAPVAPVATPANAWAAIPTPTTASPSQSPGTPPSGAGGFPLALHDGAPGSSASDRARTAAVAAQRPGSGLSTWAVWLFAALPVLHGALAWVVFGLLEPSDVGILRWVVLVGPILLYLVLAGLDRAVLVRNGQLDVAPIAYAIVPPLYLAIRVVRMGVAALAPLLVWVVLQAAVIAALAFALPQVWSALLGG